MNLIKYEIENLSYKNDHRGYIVEIINKGIN